MKTAKGSPKPVASGKKGNVGGMMTPGRHGHMLHGLDMLMKPGMATKKTAAVSNIHSGPASISSPQANLKPRGAAPKMTAGSPKMIMSSGHKGYHVGTRPEGKIKRDSASVIKP